MERVNGVLNQYLWNYLNVNQNFWGEHLSLTKVLLQLHNALGNKDVFVWINIGKRSQEANGLNHPHKMKDVTTLALGSWPRQGLAKVRAKSEPRSHISCYRKCKRVWRNEPPHSQMSSHFGSWSLNGLSNFQKLIAGVKNHWIEEFLISLKSCRNVDVEMGWNDPFGYLKHKLWPKEGHPP
jgi:hypothetical protein